MKKLLLTTVCMATLTLAACEKKGTEPAVDQTTAASEVSSKQANAMAVQQSSNNVADIQADLLAVQTLSSSKAQEAVEFQKEVSATLEKKDPKQIQVMVKKTEDYVKAFNQELDALTLKSTEVNAIRKKMQEANNLGIELTKESTRSTPDTNKIGKLQTQAAELQQSIIQDVNTLEAKTKAAPASAS